ncbi:MAG TPA: GDP-mannose 4,6-dehydratase [Candidatus Limnocylindria bacterium]|nr:GDP-mannose 4,6-dehydratase [Candidatus Limnocylindria bacterium]
MRLLITGITGFVGSYMAEHALTQGAVVFGSIRWRSKTDNIDHLRSKVTLIESDLRDLSSVRALLETANPTHVMHLAAQSFVHASWKTPAETLTTNILSQVNLLEGLRSLKMSPRFLVVGSSEEYGLVTEDELPIKETNPLRPLSPYAVSKVGQDLMGYQYWKSYGMSIVRSRAFNHSVGRFTPVLLRDDRTGLLDIKYISEIRRYRSTGYLGGHALADGTILWDMRRHPISVWADGKWTKIIHLSCHPLREGDWVLRLVSSGGIVEVTGDHSVMVPGLGGPRPASARDLALGDRVSLVDLPQGSAMWVHEDVAWLLGFFAAEGTITTGKIRIYNKDRKPLERCAEILLQHFGVDSYFKLGERDVWRLIIRRPEALVHWLHPQTYASDGNKRVPRSILNAQRDAKIAFLRGYNEGDGLRAGHGTYELKSFKTKSPILALGLCSLVTATTRQRICLNTEVREDRTYYLINLNSPNEERARWGQHLEIPEDVLKKIEPVPYEGEVWDFETEDHVFHAGLGRNLVHNTGPRRGDVFVESNFGRQVAEIEAGLRDPVIFVGDLSPRRDYSDVRDIVRGYWALLDRGEPGEVYNLCSGRSWAIQRVLDFLLEQSRVKDIKVQVDPGRLRPSDVMVLEGDPSKIEKATGWKVEIPFERTLKDLLAYWRQRTWSSPR